MSKLSHIPWFLKNKAREYLVRGRGPILISYPKSGRTWLRVMLDRLNVAVEYSHDDSSYQASLVSPDLGTDKSQYKHREVVFLVRDPRDTVVSGYFQATKRERVYEGSLSDFVRSERFGISRILRFHEIWSRNRSTPRGFLPVRYEDLHGDALGVLESITGFLQMGEMDENRLREAVGFARFDNLRALEKAGRFERRYGSILTPSDRSDGESFKMRRGRVGSYVDYLQKDDIQYCNECMRTRANPFYPL
jgi:hypothetical protein